MGMGVLVGCSLPAYAMTPLQITSNTSIDAAPHIHGDHLVWQSKVNNNWEIFHYNISTGITTQLTNNTTNDMYPQTDGDYVGIQHIAAAGYGPDTIVLVSDNGVIGLGLVEVALINNILRVIFS